MRAFLILFKIELNVSLLLLFIIITVWPMFFSVSIILTMCLGFSFANIKSFSLFDSIF